MILLVPQIRGYLISPNPTVIRQLVKNFSFYAFQENDAFAVSDADANYFTYFRKMTHLLFKL